MSALQSNPRPPPPGDEDLQHLYDEVWRIFGEESTSPPERSPLSAASLNSREHYPNTFRPEPDPAPPVSAVRNSPPRLPRTCRPFCLATDGLPTISSEQPPHAPEIRPNVEAAVSPTSQRRLRPLPLPPGAALPPVSSPTDPHEVPQAVPNTSRPGTAGLDGYAHSKPLFCYSLTSIPSSRRQLPQAPGPQSPGFLGSRGSTGSATSPTSGKPLLSPQSDIGPNIYKPVPAVPTHPNGNSPSAGDIRDQLSRKSSARPPGALAPTIPGFNGHYDDSLLDMYAAEEALRKRPSRQQLSGQSRYTDAYSLANTRLHPDNNTSVPLISRVKELQPQPSPPADSINRRSLT